MDVANEVPFPILLSRRRHSYQCSLYAAAEAGRQFATQHLVVAIEPCSKSTESNLVVLVFQACFSILLCT